MPLRNQNPFDKPDPTEYENWLNVVTQAHGQMIVSLSQDIELVKQMLKEHMDHHVTASRAALDMPVITPDEKVN